MYWLDFIFSKKIFFGNVALTLIQWWINFFKIIWSPKRWLIGERQGESSIASKVSLKDATAAVAFLRYFVEHATFILTFSDQLPFGRCSVPKYLDLQSWHVVHTFHFTKAVRTPFRTPPPSTPLFLKNAMFHVPCLSAPQHRHASIATLGIYFFDLWCQLK